MYKPSLSSSYLSHLLSLFYKQMAMKCYCGGWAVQQTAWTSANAGRRFVSCPFRRCGFFNWLDPPLCDRARVIILGLIKKINRLEAEQRNALDSGIVDVNERPVVVEEKPVKGHCSKALVLLIVTWIVILFSYLFSEQDYVGGVDV